MQLAIAKILYKYFIQQKFHRNITFYLKNLLFLTKWYILSELLDFDQDTIKVFEPSIIQEFEVYTF